MRIDPRIDEVVNGRRGMLTGIDVALDAQCLVSAVILMFGMIDALSALTRPMDAANTNRQVFVDWCNRYVRPTETLSCCSMDLYAARCGVLHTYSAESQLARDSEAHRLIYEWEAGPSAAPLPPDSIVVYVESLNMTLRLAVHEFLLDVETDLETKRKAAHHLKSMLCYAPWPRLEVEAAD